MDTVKETTLNFELDDQKRNMAESSVSAARGLPALMSNVTQAKTCNSQGKETVKHFQTETAKYSDIIDNWYYCGIAPFVMNEEEQLAEAK